MALETPNLAHAAGVAVANFPDDGPPTIRLTAGQGFSAVRFPADDSEIETEGQIWTLNRELNVREAIVLGGTQISAMFFGIVGGTPTPFIELEEEDFELQPDEVLTIMETEGPPELPLSAWCVVYAVPANGEAA